MPWFGNTIIKSIEANGTEGGMNFNMLKDMVIERLYSLCGRDLVERKERKERESLEDLQNFEEYTSAEPQDSEDFGVCTELVDQLKNLLLRMFYARVFSINQFESVDSAIECVEPCKERMQVLRWIVNKRPSHLATCIQLCKTYQEADDIISVHMDRDVELSPPVPSGGFDTNTIAHSSHCSPKYNYYDIFDAMKNFEGKLASSAWFQNWASSSQHLIEKFVHGFENGKKFIKKYHLHDHIPDNDILDCFPPSWIRRPSFTRALLKVDPRALCWIVRVYESQHEVKLINTNMLERLSRHKPMDSGYENEHCALTPHYASLIANAGIVRDSFTKSCFDGSCVMWTENDGALFGNRPSRIRAVECMPSDGCELVFAWTMMANCENAEYCKHIIWDLGYKRCLECTVLALMPTKLRDELCKDFVFLMRLIELYPFSVARLPLDLRYNSELVEIALKKDCRVFTAFDDKSRVVNNPTHAEHILCKENLVYKAFDLISQDKKESPRFILTIIRDERLTVGMRKNIFKKVPAVVKHHKDVMLTALRLFGLDALGEDSRIESIDAVTKKLVTIAHNSRSSYNRGSLQDNTAYLRSLLFDIQKWFTSHSISDKIDSIAQKKQPKTYVCTREDWPTELSLPDCDDNCTFFDLLNGDGGAKHNHNRIEKAHGFLENVAELASQILEPRRRDGMQYPGSWYCEKFEGVHVVYKKVKSEDKYPTLKTNSGKHVCIPKSWETQLQDAWDEGDLPEFWGVLHAGYGQSAKATKLKNGTLKSNADWEGIAIKVYQTYARRENANGDVADSSIVVNGFFGFFADIPENADTVFPPFVQLVKHEWIGHVAYDNEEGEILEFHRSIISKGGVGVVFRNTTTPLRLVAMDAHGYSLYAQKIVDFLTKFPLHVFAMYTNEYEMLNGTGNDDGYEEEHDEGCGGRVYPDIAKIAKRVFELTQPRKATSKRKAASEATIGATSEDAPSAKKLKKKPEKKKPEKKTSAAQSSASIASSSASRAERGDESDDGDDGDDGDDCLSELSDISHLSEVSDLSEM